MASRSGAPSAAPDAPQVPRIGKVIQRSALTVAEQREVARQQFAPLPPRPQELWTF